MEKMSEFLGSFFDRNLFDDEKLAELVDRARLGFLPNRHISH